MLAGKPRFKGRLEGVRNWSMPQIIWVQVGPQARIRDLKFFFGDPSSCPSQPKILATGQSCSTPMSVSKYGMCPGNLIFCLRFLPLLAHLAILACAGCVLLVLRLACAAQLAWPGLVPRSFASVWDRLPALPSR